MNKIEGVIRNVRESASLSLVKVDIGCCELTAVIIETAESAEWLRAGRPVHAVFNEPEVILSLNAYDDISLRNRIPCRIEGIDRGALLSRVSLNTGSQELRSVITSEAVDKLGLKAGMHVWAMVKTNEVMLGPIGATGD